MTKSFPKGRRFLSLNVSSVSIVKVRHKFFQRSVCQFCSLNNLSTYVVLFDLDNVGLSPAESKMTQPF